MRYQIISTVNSTLLRVSHTDINGQEKFRVFDLPELGVTSRRCRALPAALRFFNDEVAPLIANDKQSQIYDLVIMAVSVLTDPIKTLEQILDEVRDIVKVIYSLVDLEKITTMTKMSNKILIPAGIEVHYNRTIDNPGTVDQTYVVSEYRDMMALVCCTKFMLPIWLVGNCSLASSISRAENRQGELFNMLMRSTLITHPGMIKLAKYINYNVNRAVRNRIALQHNVGGNGQDKLPTTLLARVVTDLFIYFDPTSNSPVIDGDGIETLGAPTTGGTIVTRIYFMVDQAVKGQRTGAKQVSGKFANTPSGSGEDGSDGNTHMEEYRTADTASPADVIEIMNRCVRDLDQVIAQVFHYYPTLKSPEFEKLAKRFHEWASNNEFQHFKRVLHHQVDAQFALISWFMAPIYVPAALLRIRREGLRNITAVTQAAFWTFGFPKIAALIDAEPNRNGQFSASVTRERTRQDAALTLLKEIAPLSIHFKGSKRAGDATSRILAGIEAVISPGPDQIGLGSVIWRVRLPEELVPEVTSAPTALMRCPDDIRLQLLELYTKITRARN